MNTLPDPMTSDIPDNLIELHDPEITAEQLMEQIRERLRKRREQLGYANRPFPSFDIIPYPPEPQQAEFDANLRHHLRLANETYNKMDMEPELPPSPATRLPLIGPLWQRLRPAFHLLVLIYVNRAASQQIGVNRHMVSVLNQLTRTVEEQHRLIQALQTEVEKLRRAREA